MKNNMNLTADEQTDNDSLPKRGVTLVKTQSNDINMNNQNRIYKQKKGLSSEHNQSQSSKSGFQVKPSSRSSSRKSKRNKTDKKHVISKRTSDASFSHMSTSRKNYRTMNSKKSRKKSGTPILKFARTLDEFKRSFKENADRFVEIDRKLVDCKNELKSINDYIEMNNIKHGEYNEIIKVLQDKIGYFETKGSQHFRKHYLGPLSDIDTLRKEFVAKAENAFKFLRETKDDHIKRMVTLESGK